MLKNKPPLLLCLLFAASAAAGETATVSLHCRWRCPVEGKALAFSFAKNPMLIVRAGDHLEVTAEADGAPALVTVMKDGQPFRQDASLGFTAPDKPGAYYIPINIAAGDQVREAEICVFVPFQASGKKTAEGLTLFVDGKEMGHYRLPARSGNAKVRANPNSYQAPVWWLRMTDMNAAFEVMPGLAVGDLVAVTEDTGLKHTDLVPVHYSMWQTVRTLREALEAKGIPGQALKLISVFRAPPYNRAVGSNAFGRHIYGDAFDFYIDLEGDGKASDLNRDGKLDRRDAYQIVALIEDLQADGKIPMGGIGVYNSVGGDHVVTMHLDNRGHRATWGYLYPASGKRSEFAWQSRRFAELDRQGEQEAAARAAKEGRPYRPPHREPLQ